MTREQFKAISHDYRAVDFAANKPSNHICTARNCSCRNDHLRRHTGWQWRIAQQHGEGMATRIARMFDTRKDPQLPTSHRLDQALGRYWNKKNREAILEYTKVRCKELFAA